MNSESLADFVVASYKRAPNALNKDTLWSVARYLNARPGFDAIKRFSYDDKIKKVLQGLQSIPIAEFIDQHRHICMPFDQFWIESTASENASSTFLRRKGFLLQAKTDEISVHYANETMINPASVSAMAPKQSAEIFRQLARKLFYVRDDRFIICDGTEFMLGANGIKVLPNSMLADISKRFGSKPAGLDESKISIGEEMYRLLVFISSRNVHTNLLPRTDRAAPTFRYGNPGVPAMASTTPIQIDMAKELVTALERGDAGGIKKMLGWTSVMRFKRTYHTLEGPIVKVIEPHDRRIAAPIDRRDAPRNLTSSDKDLSLNLKTDPAKIVAPNSPLRPTIKMRREWAKFKRKT